MDEKKLNTSRPQTPGPSTIRAMMQDMDNFDRGIISLEGKKKVRSSHRKILGPQGLESNKTKSTLNIPANIPPDFIQPSTPNFSLEIQSREGHCEEWKSRYTAPRLKTCNPLTRYKKETGRRKIKRPNTASEGFSKSSAKISGKTIDFVYDPNTRSMLREALEAERKNLLQENKRRDIEIKSEIRKPPKNFWGVDISSKTHTGSSSQSRSLNNSRKRIIRSNVKVNVAIKSTIGANLSNYKVQYEPFWKTTEMKSRQREKEERFARGHTQYDYSEEFQIGLKSPSQISKELILDLDEFEKRLKI